MDVTKNQTPELNNSASNSSSPLQDPNKIEFAIIGMSFKFPDASDSETFWANLLNQKDSIVAFPKNRVEDVVYVNQNTYNTFNNFQCRVGGYLDQIDLFDHTFFKITSSEARVMDPAQRLFLQVAVEALEDASLTEKKLKGSNTGVFVGYSINEDNFVDILPKDDPNIALGNQPSVLAYRLSFLYDMKGPTMVIDTACSSSLVAVHQACQAISNNDCEQAIVGGVNVRIFPAIRAISNLGIEAFDGRCKTFDEKANGTNIGDGIAALILKRKDLAEKDGDYIYAVIKGSAVNSDGHSNGITAPNPESQTALFKKAWNNAGINPEDLAFIETHGTGTKLGDPIEVLALTQAFESYTQKNKFCPLGALKTNIGHLEATSGIAGLIKAVMCLNHKKLPPNIHFQKANPFIDFENSSVFPNNTLKTLENKSKNLLAGVSSFGISGTNCHLVIEEFKKMPHLEQRSRATTPYTFLFSVKEKESLIHYLNKFEAWLETHLNTNPEDISYTLAKGRNHYDQRLAIQANNLGELREKIISFIKDPLNEGHYQSGIYFKGAPFEKSPEIIQHFINKSPIYWDKYFPDQSAKRIPLPTYAFNERRHWPKLEIGKNQIEEKRLKSIFHELNWIKSDRPSSAKQNFAHKDQFFILFLQKTSTHEAFADYIEHQGISVYRVYIGENYATKDHKTWINPDTPSDYDLLSEQVLSNSKTLGGVIHLWDCTKDSKILNWESIRKSQQLGSFSLFHIINSLAKKRPNEEWKLINLIQHGQKILPEDADVDPTKMPAVGINKVASQEMPLVKSLAIDVELKPSVFKSIFEEIFYVEDYSEALIGYRNDTRYSQVLSQMDFDSVKNRSQNIKKEGLYLIAGGSGYLGLETAKYLASKEQVTIVLTGRKLAKELSNKQKRQIQEIENSGSSVDYIQCDVTDYESCENLIQNIKTNLGTINGVFVAIKNISHTRLDEHSFAAFSSNIRSKVQGTWLLHNFTKDMSLDFFATFSSISSLTGGPTGADCSASNLFLDSFGSWRNTSDLCTITMNYTLIDADDGSLLADRMSMIPPITKEEFIASLDLCLTKTLDFSVIVDFNSRVMKLVLPFIKINFASELMADFNNTSVNDAADAKAQKTNVTFDETLSILTEIWKDILDHQTIDRNANFFEIGGESISAVKLLHHINVQLQTKLEIADLYSYPTLEILAEEILKRQNSTNEQKSMGDLLNDLQSGKVDINQAMDAYEQIR
ncbi:MAG: Polyketide synthase PksM [Chlamydiae bacterium]|nr:Polyketide synthase PksM [Chlamydiota bacterium]